jgi:hypothetical protein
LDDLAAVAGLNQPAGASGAYLTVAESFPIEIPAGAIALFYSAGTLLGGVAAPWFFGAKRRGR